VPGQSENSAGGAGSRSAPNGQSGRSGGQTGPDQPVGTPGRQVIRTASLGLKVPDVDGTSAKVRQIGTAAGGFVGNENSTPDEDSITLQVPQPALDSVLDKLSALGTVTGRQEQSQDVTSQLVDMRSRIASQQASVDRVRALMDKAQSIGDIVQIEGELTKRESDLESMEDQQSELAGQVAMSSVTVTVDRTAPPPPAKATTSEAGFGSGLAGGWHAFLTVLRVALAVFGAVLPFLLGLGLPALAVVWLVRRHRARTRPRTEPVTTPTE
jgi:hypothetical protein